MAKKDGDIVAFGDKDQMVVFEGVEATRGAPKPAGANVPEEEMVGIRNYFDRKFDGSLDDAMDQVRPAAEKLMTSLRNLVDQPQEIELSFGVKMNASLGAIIASGEAEGHFKVTMKWIKSDD